MRKSFIFTNEEVEDFINHVDYSNGSLNVGENSIIMNKPFHVPAFDRSDWVPYLVKSTDKVYVFEDSLPAYYWKKGISMEESIRSVLTGDKIFVSFVYSKLYMKFSDLCITSPFKSPRNLEVYTKEGCVKLNVERCLDNFSLPLGSILAKELERVGCKNDRFDIHLYYNTDNIISQNELIIIISTIYTIETLDDFKEEEYTKHVNAYNAILHTLKD